MSQPNTTLSEQECGWIDECAGRLRLIQADATKAAPEKRREYLREEIARAFKNVPPSNRQRLSEALLARFPVAGRIASSAPAPAAILPPAPVAETPEEVLQRFLAVASTLPEEKRAELSRRLSEAGLVRVDRQSLVLEVADELKLKLGLQPDQQPRLTRLVELAVFVVEALCLLDERALKTMRDLSPRRPLLRRSEDFRKAAARFLASEDLSLEPQWQAMRSLLGGLLAAMTGGGKEFGRQFVERLSPTAIEDVVASEPAPRFNFVGPTRKERCWEKYVELAGDYATAALVERRIKDCLAAFVEREIMGKR